MGSEQIGKNEQNPNNNTKYQSQTTDQFRVRVRFMFKGIRFQLYCDLITNKQQMHEIGKREETKNNKKNKS